VKYYFWSITLCGAENWTFRKIDQKYPNLLKCDVEKDGEDQLDRMCEK
jgi:hypothetical protein